MQKLQVSLHWRGALLCFCLALSRTTLRYLGVSQFKALNVVSKVDIKSFLSVDEYFSTSRPIYICLCKAHILYLRAYKYIALSDLKLLNNQTNGAPKIIETE